MPIADNIKLAVVTGGGHGIGRAICRRLSRDGCDVVVADIEEDAAVAVAGEIGGRGYGVDVGDADSMAGSKRGGIGNAEDRWAACWRVNVMAHVYAARTLIPLMVARDGGYLVNVASAAGLLSQIGDAAYSATKHAAVAFAESLAITHGEQGIHVSVVCPQAVATRMIGIADDSDSLEGGFGGNDVDGILRPEDVADRIVEGIEEKRFLILPHPQVATYVQRKANDNDRWIAGMQRFQRKLSRQGD